MTKKQQITEQTSMRNIVAQFDRYYDALKALADAMRSRSVIADACITGYWQNYKGYLPDWEKDFGSKFDNIFEIILGVAKMHGLDGQAYLTEFFTACDQHDGFPPSIESFLPWKMSESQKRKLSRPGTIPGEWTVSKAALKTCLTDKWRGISDQ